MHEASITPAAPLSFRQVSAGVGHTCGVTTDNVAYCWGGNGAGQLGIGNSTGPESCGENPGNFEPIPCSTKPVRVLGNLAFRQISAGVNHTCGVTVDNVAYCWGLNQIGEVGDGTGTQRLTPVAVAPPAP
jgi:alpha-tubulin suppressor-like RCC1 family protein